MKTKLELSKSTALLLLLSTFNCQLSALAQGTAFTYQGRLNNSGNPANGSYDFQSILYDGNVGGNQQGPILTNSATAVSNGLFTVTLDFGNQFPGAARFLEIAVRTNNSGSFTTLSPRQSLTPTPYAITAGAIVSGGIPAGTYGSAVTFNNPANNFSGSGAGLIGLNASQLTSGTVPAAALGNAWQTAGNAGTTPGTQFIGTTDNQPLEIHVNGVRALRIDPTAAPSLTAGYFQNSTHGFAAATIAGGGTSGSINEAFGNYAFIGAGHGAKAATFSVVDGGAYNAAMGQFSFIGSGISNTNLADYSGIISGTNNLIQATSSYSVVGGGEKNSIQSNSFDSVLIGGSGNSILASAPFSFLGGGFNNSIQVNASDSVLVGGAGNSVQGRAQNSFLGGGSSNSIQTNAQNSVLVGGQFNSIQTNANRAVLVGGFNNSVLSNAFASVLVGGENNSVQISADHSFVGGGSFNSIQLGASGSFIGGGNQNSIRSFSPDSFLGSGFGNSILQTAQYSALAGGYRNTNGGFASTIPGGYLNFAAGDYSLAAGQQAQALHQGAFVWADSQGAPFASTANDQFCIRAQGGVGIGTSNPQGSLHIYSANNPTVVRIQSTGTPGLGRIEFVSNPQNDVNQWRPGYIQSLDAGGFTGGLGFYINGTGAANKFGSNEVMRIVNGSVGIGTTSPLHLLQVGNGVSPAYCDGTTWVNGSDRNAKSGFEEIDSREILSRVAALPISRWHYNSNTETPHIGPMAQDFYAKFQVGSDDKHIATVDEEGVALAAIQGLNQKLADELKRRDAENAELKARLEHLENLISQKVGGVK